MRTKAIVFGLFLTLLVLVNLGSVSAQNIISSDTASQYIGKTATVCGDVASATYASRSKGKPTFLNLDKPYPNHIFTAVIWIEDRSKFDNPPEVLFRGKRICVTGVVESYRNKPQIVVRSPSQIKIKSE
jgi:hypothetical protein